MYTPPKQPTSVDEMRLLFSVSILATLFGYIQTRDFTEQYLDHKAFLYGLAALGLSSAFSFFFLLATAASYKYRSRNSIDDIRLSREHKVMFYDLSVDIFGLVPLALLLSVFEEHYGFTVGALLCIVAWIVIRTIIWFTPNIWHFFKFLRPS